MILKYSISFLIVLASCSEVFSQSRTCDDCQEIQQCPNAVEQASRMDNKAAQLLRGALCGIDNSGLPKVCCLDFASPEDRELDRHPNLALLPEKCGKMDPNRIIGGTVAGLYEFPWMVLIGFDTRLGFRFGCGGSLINENYVLTAAHCVKNKKIAGIRVGEHTTNTTTDCIGVAPKRDCEDYLQDRRVEKELVHEEYDPATGRNDIALLRLKKPIRFSDEIKNAGTICLPVKSSHRSRNLANETAVVAGWGVTEERHASTMLLKVNIPVYSKQECRNFYNKNTDIVTDGNICAGKVGSDSCKGDSGGPLMLEGTYNGLKRFIQYGLVSFGPKKCGLAYPGVYTDITKYMKWILDHIER